MGSKASYCTFLNSDHDAVLFDQTGNELCVQGFAESTRQGKAQQELQKS